MQNIWPIERITAWSEQTGVIRGCNYLPRTAVNMTEMWQSESFDPNTIDQELGWATRAGYNSVRVFLQFLVWQDDAEGFKQRFKLFLAIAEKHAIRAMPILFCDCAFSGKEPYLGRQDEPIPGVHNSGWVPSPGLKRVTCDADWPDLEKYVKDFVGHHSDDERILAWDLYNEPGNSDMGDKSLALAEASFAWARATHPRQPLTTGLWIDFDSHMSSRLMDLSDFISFHAYDKPSDIEKKIAICESRGRPLICSEWLLRQGGNTADTVLPLFAKHKVGWYHWGLVAGRTQTYLPWGSEPGSAAPDIWQHDTFHADGSAYDEEELALLGNFSFEQ